MGDDLALGMFRAEGVDVLRLEHLVHGAKPFHKMIFACLICSAVRPPMGCVKSQVTMSSSGMPMP